MLLFDDVSDYNFQERIVQEQDLAFVAEKVGYRSLRRYKDRCKFLFDGISLEGIRALDIGCGPGSLTFWIALHGASYVVGLEPESAGSTAGVQTTFQQIAEHLGLNNVTAKNEFLQTLAPGDSLFDLAIMYNVINHLDEEAVQTLHKNQAAYNTYVQLLRNFRGLLSDGACVIVADSGRNNFWNRAGIKSPVRHTINWNLHQEPEMWIKVFEEAGFRLLDLRWSPLAVYPFRRFTANRLVHYFSYSHFVLRFKTP